MNKMLEKKNRASQEKQRRNRIRHSIFTMAAAVVVFVTVYALILPAITLEKHYCGYEEHQHSTDCYIDGVLVCGQVEHVHTDACREKDKESPGLFGVERKTIFGFGSQIRKRVISAGGEAYEIAVTYGTNTGIPKPGNMSLWAWGYIPACP